MEGRPLDETDLIDRARRGDEEAYAALVTQYSDLAFRTGLSDDLVPVTGRPGTPVPRPPTVGIQ